MITKALLFIREEGEKSERRLMNEITRTSNFASAKWWNQLNSTTDEHFHRLAEEQRDGWKICGPYPNAKFEIEYWGYETGSGEVLLELVA